jgi:hypothetical protein
MGMRAQARAEALAPEELRALWEALQ